jgi:hypothetical protein
LVLVIWFLLFDSWRFALKCGLTLPSSGADHIFRFRILFGICYLFLDAFGPLKADRCQPQADKKHQKTKIISRGLGIRLRDYLLKGKFPSSGEGSGLFLRLWFQV